MSNAKDDKKTKPQDSDAPAQLDPKSLQVLLESIDIAFRRGAFGVQEAKTISTAYESISTAIRTSQQQ